jgi:hypothetical protein
MMMSNTMERFFDFADLSLALEAFDSPAASKMIQRVGVVSFATGFII